MLLKKHTTFYWFAVVCILSLTCSTSQAQRKVSVTQTFEPAFRIEPLVHRLDGRRGDILKFQFRVETKNKDADIEVSLVGLRQELSGQILHDESAVDGSVVQLVNPGRYTILRDTPHIIEGIVRVPSGEAEFYSFGVLVKDFGTQRDRAAQFDANGNELTQAGINFITQYVLRLDVEVTGARGQRAESLRLEDGQLAVANGMPGMTTLIRNPTDSAFEFELRAQLKRHAGDRSFKPFKLVMPVRQSVETEERYVGRILPKSVIRMQEIVPDAVMTGEYEMEVSMLVDGRVRNKKSFAVQADSKDFPAQQSLISHVGGSVYVSPARVELSQLRGGQRRMSLEFKNNSNETRQVRLQALNDRGTPIPGLIIQPTDFTLSAGRSRRLSVSLRRTAEFPDAIVYGDLAVTSQPVHGELAETGGVPIAVLYDSAGEPTLAMDPLRWVDTGNKPAFRGRVENTGNVHVPLDARLLIVSEAGQRFTATAGYGKWLMPGTEQDLEFRMPRQLPPGKYQLTSELQTGSSPIIHRQEFTVSDFDNAQAVSQAGAKQQAKAKSTRAVSAGVNPPQVQ